MILLRYVLALLFCGVCVHAASEPLNQPLKPLPERAPVNRERVALGRQLFNDPRLSANNTLSCITVEICPRSEARV